MIPAKFDYVRPGSLDEAVTALADGGEDAKVITGGQSLLPPLRLRLAYPELLVDVGGLAGLRGVTDAGDALSIGARTTLYQLVHDPLVAEHCGLLAQASGGVADPAVRHRGTLGGALAHADPAGDLPAVALVLDATLIARGPGGERAIPAADFFVDYLTSSLEPGEILTAIRVPKLGSGWGYRYGSSTAPRSRGRPSAWPRWCGGPTGPSPRPGSGLPTWARLRSGPPRRKAPRPGRRPAGTRCGPRLAARMRARTRRATCMAHPTTAATWPGC
jgi:hypothetical protein